MARMRRNIRRTLSEVAEAAADAEAFCADAGADEPQCLRIGLALDELAANALTHGGGSSSDAGVEIEVWVEEDRLHLKVAAEGPRFDPLAYRRNGEEPEYALGGRGLALVISFADEISYQRRANRNVTTFVVGMRENGEE